MMGGVHTDIDGATPLAGLVRRGRGGLRQHQRRQPAGLQLAARVPGLRRPRRPGRRRVRRRAARRTRRRGCRPRRRDERSAAATRCCTATAGGEPIARHPGPRCSSRWRTAPASTAPADSLAKAADMLRELQDRVGRSPIDDHSRTFNTELVAALELAFMLDVAETIVALRAAARGVARRPPAHRLPGPGRRALPGPLAGLRAMRTARRRVEYLPVTITRWPPGGTGLREVAAWPTTSPCRSPGTGRSARRQPTVAGVRGPAARGLGGPRRAEPRQGPARRHAVLPLVLPDGHLRQLRHDGQRRAEADLRVPSSPTTRPARSASSRCATSR